MPECIRQTHLEQGRKQRLRLARIRGFGDGVSIWAEGFEDGAQGVGLRVGGAEGDEVVEDEVDGGVGVGVFGGEEFVDALGFGGVGEDGRVGLFDGVGPE